VVQEDEKNRREKRSDQLCVAFVGYTNAGKSSLLRALTGNEILVEDKLFATLDTPVRSLQPETHPRILVTDTVGFINKLPHDLFASFRSTLDEARNASLLLYVVDTFDNNFRTQLKVGKEVLLEIDAAKTPHLLLFNKSDCLTEEQKHNLTDEFPGSILFSTRNTANIQNLRERIIAFFEASMCEEEILVPYSAQKIIGDMRLNMKILKVSFAEEGVRLQVLSRVIDLQRLRKLMGPAQSSY
jgi:GTP-binding protein HflX